MADEEKVITLETLEQFKDKYTQKIVSKKQDTLVSGSNIKTINGESILGEGNINVGGGSASELYSPTLYGTMALGNSSYGISDNGYINCDSISSMAISTSFVNATELAANNLIKIGNATLTEAKLMQLLDLVAASYSVGYYLTNNISKWEDIETIKEGHNYTNTFTVDISGTYNFDVNIIINGTEYGSSFVDTSNWPNVIVNIPAQYINGYIDIHMSAVETYEFTQNLTNVHSDQYSSYVEKDAQVNTSFWGAAPYHTAVIDQVLMNGVDITNEPDVVQGSLMHITQVTGPIEVSVHGEDAYWDIYKQYPQGTTETNDAWNVTPDGSYYNEICIANSSNPNASYHVYMNGEEVSTTWDPVTQTIIISIPEVIGNISIEIELPQLSVVNNLSGCTTDNPEEYITEQSSYYANISPNYGDYSYTFAEILMGSEDITNTAWNGYNINIQRVTGPVEINLTCEEFVHVNGVYFSESELILTVGDELNLAGYITVTPANATNKTYEVSSNDSCVDITGTWLRAVSDGTATITVTTNDSGYQASIPVTVQAGGNIPVEGIQLINIPSELTLGETFELDSNFVEFTPWNATNQNFTVSTSEPSIISVNGQMLRAESLGDATITVTSEDGNFSDNATITVEEEPEPEEVNISILQSDNCHFNGIADGDTTVVGAELTFQIIADVANPDWQGLSTVTIEMNGEQLDNDDIIDYSHGDPLYVTIPYVTGNIDIWANCQEEPEPEPEVYSLEFDTDSIEILNNGEQLDLYDHLIIDGDESGGLGWASSDDEIITVDGGGVATVTNGTVGDSVTITVESMSNPGVEASVTVVIDEAPKITSLTFTNQQIYIFENDTLDLTSYLVIGGDPDAGMNWSSGNSNILEVDDDGIVSIGSEGALGLSASITVSAKNDSSITDTTVVTIISRD